MATTWHPHDDQIVQLLVNRGYLDDTQVQFATLRRTFEGAPSILAVLKAEGVVDEALVSAVVKQARQDELVRQLLRQYQVMSSREIAAAGRLQRGTRRSLLQTLVQEGLCDRGTLRRALGQVSSPATRQALEPVFMLPSRLEPLDIA
jgi:hypothetical protein